MKRTTRNGIVDLVSYVVIGVLCVVVTAALAVYDAKKGESPSPVLLNWLCLGGVIAIVYVTAIHEHWASRTNGWFWSGVTLALLAEIGVGALALWRAPRLSVWLWAGFYPINAVVLEEFLIRWLSLRSEPTTRRSVAGQDNGSV